MKQLIDDIKKIKWTRTTAEIVTVALIIILGLSVFLVLLREKKVVTYDHRTLTYQGEMSNNRMNGYGKLTYANGDTYQGQFKKGTFDGQGTYQSQKGWSYTGEFHKGQAHGKGVLTTHSGETYKGEFKQGIYQK